MAELRDQTQQCTEPDEQNRRADAVAPAQHCADDDDGEQRNDDDKPEHLHIMLYEGGNFHLVGVRAPSARSRPDGNSEVVEQPAHAAFDLIADQSHRGQIFAGRVVKFPIFVSTARHGPVAALHNPW